MGARIELAKKRVLHEKKHSKAFGKELNKKQKANSKDKTANLKIEIQAIKSVKQIGKVEKSKNKIENILK